VVLGLWVICELAIAACDLAEVIGSAIALNLLFGIPLALGVVLTALDVLLVLLLQNRGFRLLEALVITLVFTVGACFFFEIIISRPDAGAVFAGFVPDPEILRNPQMLYIAMGILGATVMPHNLYLHSSIVQTRRYEEHAEGKREAVRYAFLDSTIALSFALFINAAILIVAAASFHHRPHRRGRDRPRVQAAHAAAGRGRGQHGVRAGAAGLGAELHAHGHAGGADRDGGVPGHPPAPLGAAADHARHRHRPGGGHVAVWGRAGRPSCWC
jgi:Mn2+/Fe2+ NRAMP family transporter